MKHSLLEMLEAKEHKVGNKIFALALMSGGFSICDNLENFMQYLYRGLHRSVAVRIKLCYNIL